MTLRQLARIALLSSAIGLLVHWPGFAAATLTQTQQDAWDAAVDKSFIIANTSTQDWTLTYQGLPDGLDRATQLDLKDCKVTILDFNATKKQFSKGKEWAPGTKVAIKAQGLLVFDVTPPPKGWFDSSRESFVGMFRLEDSTKGYETFLIKRKGGDNNQSKVPTYEFGRVPFETLRGVTEPFPKSNDNGKVPTFGTDGFVIAGDKFNSKK